MGDRFYGKGLILFFKPLVCGRFYPVACHFHFNCFAFQWFFLNNEINLMLIGCSPEPKNIQVSANGLIIGFNASGKIIPVDQVSGLTG